VGGKSCGRESSVFTSPVDGRWSVDARGVFRLQRLNAAEDGRGDGGGEGKEGENGWMLERRMDMMDRLVGDERIVCMVEIRKRW